MPTRCGYPNITSNVFFQGANGSTDIKDECGNYITCGGNASLTTTSPKFGISCATFDGNDYMNVGTTDIKRWSIPGDFFVMCWGKFTSVSGYQNLFGIANTQLRVRTYAGTTLLPYYGTVSGSSESVSFTTGTWYQLIMCRSGTTCRTFWNGTRLTNVTKSGTINTAGSPLSLGTYQESATDQNLNGQLGYIIFCNGMCPPQFAVDSNITVMDTPFRGKLRWY